MEINSQTKTLTLDVNTANVTSIANSKNQQSGQNVPTIGNDGRSQSTPREKLTTAVSNINDHVQSLQRSLQFTVDEVSGKDIVTVLDKETQEVIRQYPSEEVLAIARRLSEDKDNAISLFHSQA